MADDSDNIQEEFKFHPCDTPRGMKYYKLTELTEEQQIKLNGHKINIIRQNQIYLNDHPEVKAIVSTILRAILRERPKVTLQEFLSKYFSYAWPEIKKEIDRVIAEKAVKVPAAKIAASGSTILRALEEMDAGREEASVHVDEFVLRRKKETKLCRGILDDIITGMKSDASMYTADLWDSTDADDQDVKATPYPSEITLYTYSKDDMNVETVNADIEEFAGE